jgi:hypothetical protein
MLTCLVLAGCPEETDGPVPTLEKQIEPPATCNFSNAENAEGEQVVILRSPDGTFSPMARDGLADPPGLDLPRVFLVQGDTEIEVLRVEFVSTSEIHVVIDASLDLPQGSYQFRVVNPNGHASELSDTFEVFDPPTIVEVSPNTVCNFGQLVTITGSGFREGTTVTVGGEPLANQEIVDDMTITGTVPDGLATDATYDVVITSPEGCTATVEGAITIGSTVFTVEAIVPDRGWTGIDNPVTIYGEGFIDGMTVELIGAAPDGGNWPLDFVTVDPSGTFIEAVVPAGGEPGGPYPVSVAAPDGCFVDFEPGFTIDADEAIVLSEVIPPFGWTDVRTPVTITGTGFISTPRAYLVIPSGDDTVNPLHKLLSTAFVTDTTLNATVPSGLPPGGPYDLIVINPDGGGGKLEAAFTVTSEPTPEIFDVTPGAGTTQDDTDVVITGCNFRDPLTVELRDENDVFTAATVAGAPDCNGAATCPGGTNVCTLDATFPTTTMDVGAYVVRLTDEDEGAWGEWSAFVVTNPAVKLNVWALTSPMTQGRAGHAAVSGRINNPSRFIYAIGGNGGSPANPFDSIEVVPLDIFGNMGDWFEQRYRLNTPRSDLTAIQRGGYIYAIGGRSDATTAVDTIERAKILLDDESPTLVDPPSLAEGTLEAGTWYYVVSAVRPMTDPDNPGGETLPSDEVVVTLGIGGGVVLEWSEVTDATAYRIYRTELVDGVSRDEVFLAEVAGDVLTYTDDGSDAVDPDERPLRRGATGVWVTLGAGSELNVAQYDHETVIADDPNGDTFVYVLGGSGACSDCFEFASLSDDGVTLGSWTQGTETFTEDRTQHAAAVADPVSSPQIPAGEAYIYLTGGVGVTESLEAAQVQVGGQLGAFTVLDPPESANPAARELAEAIIVNDSFYLMGGRTANQPLSSAVISIEIDTTAPARTQFSSSSNQMMVAREDYALVLESAFFYAIGGLGDGGTALSSVDTVIY